MQIKAETERLLCRSEKMKFLLEFLTAINEKAKKSKKAKKIFFNKFLKNQKILNLLGMLKHLCQYWESMKKKILKFT